MPRKETTPHLRVYWGRVQQKIITLREGDELLVGSGHRADVVVPDPTVSFTHCMVRMKGRGVTVTDLNSKNGTWVNGHRISSNFRLSSGDIIQFGYITVVYIAGDV